MFFVVEEDELKSYAPSRQNIPENNVKFLNPKHV